MLDRLQKLEGVRNVLGRPDGETRTVTDGEIGVLRSLCSHKIDPKVVPLPEKGERARIRSGPMAGASGIVLRADGTQTVLAFSLPIMAGAYELTVPTRDVVCGPKAPPVPAQRAFRFKRRGGKRMRRFLRNVPECEAG